MLKKSSEPTATNVNLIAEGTVFEGTLRAESEVRVSGRLVGEIHVKGRVVVAQEGVVEGKITATEVDISGRVQGDLHVEECLTLRSRAQVEGTVETARLIVEEGAQLNGACRMGAASAPSSAPSSTPASAPRSAVRRRESTRTPAEAASVSRETAPPGSPSIQNTPHKEPKANVRV